MNLGMRITNFILLQIKFDLLKKCLEKIPHFHPFLTGKLYISGQFVSFGLL